MYVNWCQISLECVCKLKQNITCLRLDCFCGLPSEADNHNHLKTQLTHCAGIGLFCVFCSECANWSGQYLFSPDLITRVGMCFVFLPSEADNHNHLKTHCELRNTFAWKTLRLSPGFVLCFFQLKTSDTRTKDYHYWLKNTGITIACLTHCNRVGQTLHCKIRLDLVVGLWICLQLSSTFILSF